MKLKYIACGLFCTLLMAGCGAKPEETPEETKQPSATDGIEITVKETSTECGQIYSEFLKLGSMTAEAICAEHPQWTYDAPEGFEIWSYEDDKNMISYKRDLTQGISNYTIAFHISPSVIDNWINQELDGLDDFLSTKHTRDVIEGAYWHYTWTEVYGDTQLKVVKTQSSDDHVAILSINRQGGTALDSSQVEVVKQ